MEFYTAYKEGRPVRLSEETRKFAYESLNHKYGQDTRKTPFVSLDYVPEEDYSSMSPLDRYDLAIRTIASKAPIRICDGEKISGAATLGGAISHVVPAQRDGKTIFGSVSHLTIDYEKVLKTGLIGLRREVSAALKTHEDERKIRFLHSAITNIDSMVLWHRRYLEALKGRPEYRENYRNLSRVPLVPAETFYEAVQCIWFVFAYTRLCGNWPGIGRIDLLLGEYLRHDMAMGILTIEEAREILAHFFIKGCEWVSGGNYGSGDAQHYQNIVLSGVDSEGKDITNDVTYLVLDIIEELGISDFPVTVRISSNSSEKLLHKVAEVIRHGGGVIAVYNEDLIVKSLTEYGYDIKEARNYANDGCWEVQIPGKTYFIYAPFDSLAILQRKVLMGYENVPEYGSFEELYAAFAKELKEQVDAIGRGGLGRFERLADGSLRKKPSLPCTVISLFEIGCIENAASYYEGGPVYEVYSPHIGGLADTVNSLYAINKLVFCEKKVTFSQLMEILAKNWEGYEDLRCYVSEKYTYYGNDNDEVDAIACRILEDFASYCKMQDGICPIMFPGGVSTFGRQIEWSRNRLASPFGRRSGEVLSGNANPTPGTDLKGATAIIKSYCKADLSKLQTGAALDIRLMPSDVAAEKGLETLASLIRGFVSLGGFFLQMDIADRNVLIDAQAHPENYQTLSVRVSGWNARFVTLNKEWQDMLIQETKGE